MKGKIPALAKRSLAFALALALLLSLCPVIPLTAKAAHTGEWTYLVKGSEDYKWISGAFTADDADLIYENDQPYDWKVTVQPTKTPPPTVDVVATIKDANGNQVDTYTGTASLGKNALVTLFTAANFAKLTTDLTGDFTLICDVNYNGTTYAHLEQSFSREAAGSAVETTAGAEDETTAGAEDETTAATTGATTPDEGGEGEGATTHTGEWTYLVKGSEDYKWISGAFTADDADLIYDNDQPYDWKVTVHPTKTPPPSVDVVASIKDANGDTVSTYTGTAALSKGAEVTLFTSADFAELTVGLSGSFMLICNVNYNGTTYAHLEQTFSRTGDNGEGGETPDEPDTPDQPGSTVNTAKVYLDILKTPVLEGGAASVGGLNFNTDPVSPLGIGTIADANRGLAAWNLGPNTALTITLSEEFLADFDGKAIVTVEYVDSSHGAGQLVYHSTSGTATAHPSIMTLAGNGDFAVQTATFELTDAEFTNVYEKGASLAIYFPTSHDGRFYLKSVTVEKTSAMAPGNNYSVDLSSSVADLVFLDETPFDLSLDVATDGNIEVVDVTYTLSGGNVNGTLTETKKVTLNKEGVNVLNAAWFTEKAIGFGDFVLNVTMANEEKELANKTFNFSRKMTSILASELKSEIAENKDGVLVFGEDDVMDLQLFLKNKLSVPFNGTATVSYTKNGTPFHTYDFAIEALEGEAKDMDLYLPEMFEYAIYELNVVVKDAEGNEVHNKTFTFARQKTEFVSAELSSATYADLVFVDNAPFDMGLNLQKTDGYDETLNIVWGIFKGEEKLSNGKFSKGVTAAAATPVKPDWSGAVGYGNFTLKLQITNSLGYVQNVELPFSRIESVKVDLTSESNPDLIFAESEAFDLKLSLLKQSGEDKVFTVNYSVVNEGTTVKSGSFADVAVTDVANVLDLDMAAVEGTGAFTITVALVDAEGNTVKTVEFQASRVPAMEATLSCPNAGLIGDKITFVDMVPYDFQLTMQKQAGNPEKMTLVYIVTDLEGNELINETATGTVGSTEPVTAPLDLSLLTDYGTFLLNVYVLDASGNQVVQFEGVEFVRVEYITSKLVSATNSDLIFTEGQDFDLGLGIYNSNPAGVEPLQVVYEITGDGLAEPITFSTRLNASKIETYINDHTSLADLPATGTFTLTLKIGVEGILRHQATYTFSRVALADTINSAIKSESNASLVYAPGGNIDMMLYLEKTDGIAEGFNAVLSITDAEGNAVLPNVEAPIRPFTSTKFKIADLFDLTQIVNPGVYTIALTLTDNSGNVRHTNSVNFTLVSLEGSVETAITSESNPDLIFTEGEEYDLVLHMRKNDGVAEAFKAFITITDANGNVLKEKEAKISDEKVSMKTDLSNLIDLSDLPATGSFNLNLVLVDASGNERLNQTTPFARVKLASVKTQISSNTNKDMIFIDKDTVDLNLYVQKTDGIAEELYIHYILFDPNGDCIAEAEGKTVVPAGDKYFKQAIELEPEMTAMHGTYEAILTITDNNGNVRVEATTRFARISGAPGEIKHQVSGSSTGTKMQFTPGMNLDLCLFLQKLDGVPETLPGELYVTAPSGKVVYSIKGNLNVPAGARYFKFPLPLNGLCNEFGIYTVSYSMKDDAGNHRVSGSAKFKIISPTGDMAVSVQSASGKPGMIYTNDEPFDLVLYLQKADGVEQTLKLRYTIYDINGLVMDTKQGNVNVPALGYRKVPIELPDIDAFDKFGIFTMKVEVAGVDGKLIYNETFSFSRVLTPEKQMDIMGVCTHLSKRGMTTKQSQQYVDLARMAGISFWRDELPWSTVEPAKGQYRIPDSADAAVDYTLSIGLEPLFILDYGNDNYGSDVTTDEWLQGYLGYVEYMVTHFKGRIKYYEVWNEWNIGLGGMDKKYRDQTDLYAKLLIETYKVIKAIDPTITVIGGVVAGGEEKWTENFLKYPDVINYMDVFSYHEYPDNDFKEFIEQYEVVRELMAKYGKPDMPLWVTETGWPTHIGRASFTAEESAGNLVSLYTWAIANPGTLDQIFWYDLHNDGVERENPEHNFGLLGNWDADTNNVPMTAKPSFVALCAMNTILADAEFIDLYDMGHKKITAYHFKKDGKDLLVAWADDVALNMIANVGENNIIVTDMYGNASALTPVDGKVSLFFSDAPIYIEYDLSNKLEMVEGGFTLDQAMYSATPAAVFPVKITRNNGLETQSGSYAFSMPETWSVEGIEFGAAEAGATEIVDTVYVTVGDDASKGEMTITARVVIEGNVVGQFNIPIEMGDICTVNPDVVFTENGPEFKVSVQVINENSTKPLSGTINMLAPAALIGEASSVAFEIPAGENKAVLIDVPAEYANTFHTVKVEVVLGSGAKHEVSKPMSFLYAIEAPENMNLDGVIDEQWDGAMEFTIGEDDWVNSTDSDAEWPGNTAKGYAMWDKDYLYVAVVAHDASHYQTGTGTSIWMGDSIQLTTDVSRFTVPAYYGYNEIGFSLNSDNGTIENWNWFASPGKNVSEGGIFKIIRDDAAETTTYEVALPWSELLPKEVEFGFRSLGFALIVNENSIDEEGDPTGRTGWIEYMSGIGIRKEPEKFGDLILVKRSELN